jgi:hypothetical protein
MSYGIEKSLAASYYPLRSRFWASSIATCLPPLLIPSKTCHGSGHLKRGFDDFCSSWYVDFHRFYGPDGAWTALSVPSFVLAVRIRPVTTQDAVSIPPRFQRTVIHDTTSTSVSVDPTNGPPAQAAQQSTGVPAKKQSFNFDQVHGQGTTQHALYTSTAQPLVSRFLEGFNCTILAYGQTSSGKTHSMTGKDLDGDPTDTSNGMGIIPRAVAAIFSRAQELKSERNGGWQYSVKGSFIELYNEDLIDLLVDDSTGVRREVQIREDKDGHIIWGGLREVTVRNAAEVMK